MAGFLLDTNHLSEALRPVSRVRDRIGQVGFTGIRVGTCIPVLCELEAALPSSSRGHVYRRALQRLLGRVRVWPLELETALLYGEIFRELRGCGRVLSQVDMMLAALARQRTSLSLRAIETSKPFRMSGPKAGFKQPFGAVNSLPFVNLIGDPSQANYRPDSLEFP
jgi:predicted nucleic acid-binding protein